ncbi:MAG TPA: hypothetical protein EYM84_08040 [Flavobacteriales bacterium]|nr:hypothetical protein [Flavobacteriales bacterium]HIN40208.1 hypothetical protein [Flavobacteriales bacterium]
MKRIFTITICLALVIPMFNSCKKGENDPMSLKSRKARLAGEWELAEWSRTELSGSSITTYTFSGSTLMVLSGSYTSTVTHSETLEIAKDGTFELNVSQFANSASYTYTSTGIWYWLKGNKELEYKNKERVGFEVTASTTLYSSGTYSSTDISSHTGDASDIGVYRIDQLKSKEMIIVTEFTDMDGSDLTTVTETKTYEKQ